jgi:hypothetical protein
VKGHGFSRFVYGALLHVVILSKRELSLRSERAAKDPLFLIPQKRVLQSRFLAQLARASSG